MGLSDDPRVEWANEVGRLIYQFTRGDVDEAIAVAEVHAVYFNEQVRNFYECRRHVPLFELVYSLEHGPDNFDETDLAFDVRVAGLVAQCHALYGPATSLAAEVVDLAAARAGAVVTSARRWLNRLGLVSAPPDDGEPAGEPLDHDGEPVGNAGEHDEATPASTRVVVPSATPRPVSSSVLGRVMNATMMATPVIEVDPVPDAAPTPDPEAPKVRTLPPHLGRRRSRANEDLDKLIKTASEEG